MVVLARLLFCWNPSATTGRIRFPSPARFIHRKKGISQEEQGMFDKEKLWSEAEQCLSQLGSESMWSPAALFRSDLAPSLRPGRVSDHKSKLEGLKRLRDLLAANPWLRQRRRFASKKTDFRAKIQKFRPKKNVTLLNPNHVPATTGQCFQRKKYRFTK